MLSWMKVCKFEMNHHLLYSMHWFPPWSTTSTPFAELFGVMLEVWARKSQGLDARASCRVNTGLFCLIIMLRIIFTCAIWRTLSFIAFEIPWWRRKTSFTHFWRITLILVIRIGWPRMKYINTRRVRSRRIQSKCNMLSLIPFGRSPFACMLWCIWRIRRIRRRLWRIGCIWRIQRMRKCIQLCNGPFVHKDVESKLYKGFFVVLQ